MILKPYQPNVLSFNKHFLLRSSISVVALIFVIVKRSTNFRKFISQERHILIWGFLFCLLLLQSILLITIRLIKKIGFLRKSFFCARDFYSISNFFKSRLKLAWYWIFCNFVIFNLSKTFLVATVSKNQILKIFSGKNCANGRFSKHLKPLLTPKWEIYASLAV